MEKSIWEHFIPKKKLDILQIEGNGAKEEHRLKKPGQFKATVMRMGLLATMDILDDNALLHLFEQVSESMERVLPGVLPSHALSIPAAVP